MSGKDAELPCTGLLSTANRLTHCALGHGCTSFRISCSVCMEYQLNVDLTCGGLVGVDYCRGPHVPSKILLLLLEQLLRLEDHIVMQANTQADQARSFLSVS